MAGHVVKECSKNGKLHVDILKAPQHGSAQNVDPMFWEGVTADHYIFSGNGARGNPEREALEMIMKIREDEDYTLHFTYPIEEIDVTRKQDWQKGQAKDRKKHNKNPAIKVRPNWGHKAQPYNR